MIAETEYQHLWTDPAESQPNEEESESVHSLEIFSEAS